MGYVISDWCNLHWRKNMRQLHKESSFLMMIQYKRKRQVTHKALFFLHNGTRVLISGQVKG